MFHDKCLRRVLQIQWQGHVSTEEPLERAEMKPLSKKERPRHAWKLMPEIGPNRMSHSYQSSCLKFARVHFAFSARGAEIGQDFPF